jgi:hypothetical protein
MNFVCVLQKLQYMSIHFLSDIIRNGHNMCDNKLKLFLRLIKCHILQTYGDALLEAQIYSFLIPAVNGVCRSISHPGCSVPVLTKQKAGWAPKPDKML